MDGKPEESVDGTEDHDLRRKSHEKRQHWQENRKYPFQHPVHRLLRRYLGMDGIQRSVPHPADYRADDCSAMDFDWHRFFSGDRYPRSHVLGLCVRAAELPQR